MMAMRHGPWGEDSPAPADGRRRRLPLAALTCLAVLLLACSGKKAAPAPATTLTPRVVAGTVVAGVPNGGSTPSALTSAATAQPLSASRVETVKTVYDLLLDRYYRPLKPNDLLASAWAGAKQAAGSGAGNQPAPKLTGDRTLDWEAYRTQYEQLYRRAAGAVQGTALAFGAVQSMTAGLNDDHTYFLNPEDNKRRQASDSGGERFVGIGVTLSNRAPFMVVTIVTGAPADKAGIRPGDTIVAIDGEDATTLSSQSLGDRLRGGAAGSAVRLTVKRAAGPTDPIDVVRAQIVQPAIETKLLAGGIGYIALHNFADAYARFADGHNIAETLDLALQSFEQAGVAGWVFDVRGNPGGSEQTLAEVAGRFVAGGIVLQSVDREHQVSEGPVDGHLYPVQRPLAVLIDGQSGSASELFAATIKEYGRGHLVGQRTAGAVNGALETELPDGAAVQYTVVEGRTGKEHRLLDGAGVSPDETVGGRGSPEAVLAGQSDEQFDRAKEWVLGQAKKSPIATVVGTPAAEALPAADIRKRLASFAAVQSDIPAGPGQGKFGDLVLTQPNELAIGIAADVPNAATFIETVRGRHWQGGYQQYFGSGEPAPYIVAVDFYRDVNGAYTAVTANDYPGGLKAVPPPAHLGDDTVAYAGYDAADGSSQIVWRRGRLVFTVQFTTAPGQSGLSEALTLARKIDARAATQPAP